MHFMNGLNQTILRKPIPVYHKMFSPHTERLSDTADQSRWWKFKSPCTMTTCPADQSQRLPNTYLKFWEVLPLMLPTPAQKRLKKETFWKILTIFLWKNPSIFMLLTIIVTLHVEYQRLLISFIATLKKQALLPTTTTKKNSSSRLITRYYTTREWGSGETYPATWKNSDWISQFKTLTECQWCHFILLHESQANFKYRQNP